jgi:hypothetical protein
MNMDKRDIKRILALGSRGHIVPPVRSFRLAKVVIDPVVVKDAKSIEIKAVDLPAVVQPKPLAVIPVYEPFVPSQPKPISTPKPDILPNKPKNDNVLNAKESLAQEVDKVELLNGVVKKSSEKHRFSKAFFGRLAIGLVVLIIIGLTGYFGYINLRIYI